MAMPMPFIIGMFMPGIVPMPIPIAGDMPCMPMPGIIGMEPIPPGVRFKWRKHDSLLYERPPGLGDSIGPLCHGRRQQAEVSKAESLVALASNRQE